MAGNWPVLGEEMTWPGEILWLSLRPFDKEAWDVESLMIINPERVRELRERKGWSQEILAEAAGLGVRTIQRIESQGGASKESVLCIAAALDVAVRELELATHDVPINTTSAVPQPDKPPILVRLGMLGIYRREAAIGFMWLSLGLAVLFVLLGAWKGNPRLYWGGLFTLAALWYWGVAHWMAHHPKGGRSSES